VTSGKLYSERARCQHQFWEIYSNANANSNWPAYSSKLQIKREKMREFSTRRSRLRENFTHDA
jgi:hypothetical protein